MTSPILVFIMPEFWLPYLAKVCCPPWAHRAELFVMTLMGAMTQPACSTTEIQSRVGPGSGFTAAVLEDVVKLMSESVVTLISVSTRGTSFCASVLHCISPSREWHILRVLGEEMGLASLLIL